MQTINLGLGHPKNSILPLDDVRAAAVQRLSNGDPSCLQYGPEQGFESFRNNLAAFLSENYGTPVTQDSLMVTAGVSHALDLILSRMSKPGDIVFVEDPSYFLAFDIFRSRQLSIVPMLTDGEGIVVEALEEQLRDQRPNFLYTIPSFQNPTGTVLPESRRKRLAELAVEYDFLILADEVYQLLGDPGAVPLPLRAFDAEQVLSLGSFTKILGPGLRLGWIECSPKYMSQFIDCPVIQSGGGVSAFTSCIVDEMLATGIQQKCLDTLRDEYSRRRTHMVSLLDRILPDSVTFVSPKGGYFVWLELPSHVDTRVLRKEGRAMHINFKPGEIFSCRGGFTNCLRLCWTYYDIPDLEFACEQLNKLIRKHL